jgi:ribonuclease T1
MIKMKTFKIWISILLLISLFACQKVPTNQDIAEDGYYTSKEDVSLYLITYHRLPNNYITKDQAEELGWDNDKGNLWEVTDKKSIGGDRFYNREGLLPKDMTYYECDIDYEGGYRNAKRIVYSSDWAVYYTDDHYDSFEMVYEGE